MKKTDYQIKKQNTKVTFSRAVKLNDKDMNISIDVTMNHNKGLYTIQPKVATSHVEDTKVKRQALCKTIGDLTYEAIVYAENWRKEWAANQPKDDNQLPMGFDED